MSHNRVVKSGIVLCMVLLFASGWAKQNPSSCSTLGFTAIVGAFIYVAFRFINKQRADREKAAIRSRCAAWHSRKKTLRSMATDPVDWDTWIDEGENLADACDAWAELADKALEVRDTLRPYESARALASMQTGGSKNHIADSITQLSQLRAAGLISDSEFSNFTDKFKRSPGTKAREVLTAIEQLHAQYKAGALQTGNYHAALWTLMDRLERDLK
jgi:hypothetical protein